MRGRISWGTAAVLFAVALFVLSCSREPEPLPAVSPPSLQSIGEWGTAGEGPGRFKEPASIATDSAGRVYVADAGSGLVHKFDPEGKPMLSFGGDRLQRPTGIAVDRDRAIYVADYLNDRVVAFSPDGAHLRKIRGGQGRPFNGPIGVAVDNEGNLFVIEFDGHRIQKFNVHGRFLKAWGKDGSGPGEFHFPIDLAIGPDGNLYVADTHNRRVQKFTREGQFLAAWGMPGTATDMMHDITGIAVSAKHVFLTDSGNHRIQVWTLDGHHVLTDEAQGQFRSALQTPTDVALGSANELLVLNPFGPSGPRVLRFRINL